MNYDITCDICQKDGILSIYRAESGRSGYTRSLEHSRDLRNKQQGTPLSDHVEDCHKDSNISINDFTMKIMPKNSKPINRLISEGIFIQQAVELKSTGAKINILNSKSDFHQPGLTNLKVINNPLDEITNSSSF